MMAFKFPFTNYHELNLNWVLEELKKLFEDSEENVSTIETYDERLTAVETELPTVSATAQDAAQNAAAASTAAQQATATANAAQENATQAQALAGFARQEAQAAQTAADAATQAAQQATATAQNFDGRITQAQNDASTALEASRSFENRVQSAITTANNAANTATNAQGIAMRADQNAALALDTLNAQRTELERIGAEQVELITEETEDKKTEIENLAQSVLDSIPSDYTELSELVDKKAPVIIDTAAGFVASFDDGADNMKIQKLVVNIEPVQAGSGWTGAEVTRTGKNLANLFNDGKVPSVSNGALVNVNGYRSDFIPFKGNAAFTFSEKSGDQIYILYYDGDKRYLSYDLSSLEISNTSPANTAFVMLRKDGGNAPIEAQLEYGSATAYEPYTSNQISVTFPSSAGDSGTVYGGTLTLNPDRTGTLVVNGAEPQTYHLTAEQISGILTTLYGTNNIWADTGDVEVTYPADTKLYIDGKLAELQATILENI